MVDTESTRCACRSYKPDGITPPTKKSARMDSLNFSREALWGWISSITLALRSEEKFFLDIPFYRTH